MEHATSTAKHHSGGSAGSVPLRGYSRSTWPQARAAKRARRRSCDRPCRETTGPKLGSELWRQNCRISVLMAIRHLFLSTSLLIAVFASPLQSQQSATRAEVIADAQADKAL